MGRILEEDIPDDRLETGPYERVLLVAVGTDGSDLEESLDELAELVETAGALTVGRVIQLRDTIHPGTYMGSGKVAEVRELLEETGATGIVCDDELSPAQLRNLEQALETKVMDRTLVILDIFAARAVTSEGKLQVELAQLRYRLARLVGLGHSLSRLGGGIGTRGPGEKKLEMDRRYIKSRIAQLNREQKELQQHRQVTRSRRTEQKLPVAAIVGYTNAGKSSLLNRLTGAKVLSENKLFATLDPTTRRLCLEGGQELLLTDTVGFIRKLPHHLIEAFRSTLEEAKYADIILHVVDASNPRAEKQMFTVYETLRSLQVSDKIIVTLFNKQDVLTGPVILRDFQADKSLPVSVKTGQGLDDLLHMLEEILLERQVYVESLFSYDQASQVAQIRKYGTLLFESYEAEGIYVKAYVPRALKGQLDHALARREKDD
ncbi:MAG: GTPase HflX [Lachnospiraceae bacterium]|nr:GTPase HflX [Lachnospiraceae bacterium]